MGTKYSGSEKEVRALNALINLMRAGDAVAASLHLPLARRKLTSSQFGVLEALLHLGPLYQGELAKKQLRCGGSITAVVDGLEKRGLVVRQRDSQDMRFVKVDLTAQGRALIRNLFPSHARSIARRFSVLSAAEQEELRRLCRKLGKSIQQG